MMRIGFDAKRAFFNSRGLGNYSRDMIRIMKESDNELFLFTPDDHPCVPFDSGGCNVVLPQGFVNKHFPAFWRTYGCSSQIADCNLDVFHGLSNELPFGLNKTSLRKVITMHDVIFLKHPEWFPFFDRLLFKKKYVESCRRADYVVAISEATKRDVVDLIGVDESKISVVYQRCDPLFSHKCPDDVISSVRAKYNLPSHFILTVCAIEERKNHQCVIRALSRMKNRIPYVIVGRDSAYKDVLLDVIASQKVSDSVFFLHDVPTSDLPAVYQMADVLAFPSFYEGFGIPLIEAQFSILPVVTSMGSCFQEVCSNGALYADPSSPDDWAAALDKVLDDSLLRQSLVSAGASNALRYTAENVRNMLMKIYND